MIESNDAGEEGCWVPPRRKFSGVPSLAAFRRAALTPWNSQDSSYGTGSPPDSPCHHLFQEATKLDKKNRKKETAGKVNGKLTVSSGLAENCVVGKEEAEARRIDRLFRPNGGNYLDKRRVKSSEIITARGRNPLVKSAALTDGRDSIRLKNSMAYKDSKVKSYPNTRIKARVNKNNKSENHASKPRLKQASNRVSDFSSQNSENEVIKNPVIEVTTSSQETNESSNCDNISYLSDSSNVITNNYIREKTNTNKLNVENKDVNSSINVVNRSSPKLVKPSPKVVQRSASPYRPGYMVKPKVNTGLNGRSFNRLTVSRKVNKPSLRPLKRASDSKPNNKPVQAIITDFAYEGDIDDRDIVKVTECSAVRDDSDSMIDGANHKEDSSDVDETSAKDDSSLEDDRSDKDKGVSSLSSDSEDDNSDDIDASSKDDDSGIKENSISSDNKGVDFDSSCDDDKDDEPVDEPDEKSIPSEKSSPRDPKLTKKMDTLEVPSSRFNGSPRQLLRIHGVTLTKERLKKLRSIVDKAAQRKKVFTIFGKYPSIRDALLGRGWIQNFDYQKLSSNHARQNDNEVSMYAKLKLGSGVGEEELALISRMLKDTPVHFVWIMGDSVDWKSLSKSTIVSRFPRVYFTTKVGLCSYLEESHWFCEASVSHVNFPRCYTTDDLASFVRDFRLTACLGLIRTLISAIDNNQPDIFSGKIPLSAVKFAVKRCCEFVSVEEHQDIDMESEERVWDHQWDQFLTYYYQFVHEGEAFVPATQDQVKALYWCCETAVKGVRPYWPQMDLDGVTNLWLVKPGAKSRGRGISVCNKLERIMAKLGSTNQPSTDLNPPASSSRFVIQKYVERPLLIHNTKFDIRQWFLVTCAYPLTIWMYKESYLRFCSQLFSLSNLHESVHLTNNAVQCRYRNQVKRDKALPDENMWDSYTFQAYLRTLGRRDEWESVVYPGMRESITGALLAAQDHMEPRQNCFELYGADFILTEDLKPWLIEINSSPALSATTSVTARMCPQCLEDVIKVVIDRRTNRDAPTGQFELIYRQNVSTPQPYMGMNLTVRGSAAPRGKVPPPAWLTSPDGAEHPSHHATIQSALESLADHLVSESDLLINTSVNSLAGEDGSKECTEESSRNGHTTVRKRAEKRCSLYRKHSCLAPLHRNYATLTFTNRTHRLYKKQMRINSVLLSMRRVSLVPTSDLLDWRQRVEQARALCSSAVARMTGQRPAEQQQRKQRSDWIRMRKAGRKKKSRDKDRATNIDDIRLWNQVLDDRTALSDQEQRANQTVIGLSPSSNNPKVRKSLSSKGRLFQDWKHNKFNNVDTLADTNILITQAETEVTEDKDNQKKVKTSNSKSPKSPSGRRLNSSRPSHGTQRSRVSSLHWDRSPSPRFHSLSPNINSLAPSYFDLTATSTSLIQTKYFSTPLSLSDLTSSRSLSHDHKYMFKSSSMINLPALLRTK